MVDSADLHAAKRRYGPVLDGDVLDVVERLVEELKAIEQWDAAYWRNRNPEVYETVAFVARRHRRREILSRLLSMVPR